MYANCALDNLSLMDIRYANTLHVITFHALLTLELEY